MGKDLEQEILNLRRELAEMQKEKAVLRLQPCRGDSEIKEKDAKFDELERQAKAIKDSIRDFTRKRQLLISQSATKGSYESPNSYTPSQG